MQEKFSKNRMKIGFHILFVVEEKKLSRVNGCSDGNGEGN